MEKKIPFKSWSEDDLPREKLLAHGRRYLSDAELIAILIRSGSRGETAVELSRKILTHFNNDLNKLGAISAGALSKFKGIGIAKATAIVAALEIGRRKQALPITPIYRITSARDVYEYLQPCFADLTHEEFWILLLNRSNVVLSRQQISKGGQAGTVADPKIIFKVALEQNAAYIVLAHNHPSGLLKPSEADKLLTRKLIDAGKLLELRIYDHLIITNNGYYSFSDEGLIF